MSKVIVIGAGAAGLMCAAAAASQGHRVTVYEKNEKAGKKIYITGKGRCNLTNDCEPEEFLARVARNPKFLYSALYGFDQRRTMAFFEENGCRLKTERGQRVFPVSDHASDVTRALTECLRRQGVSVRYRTEVASLLLAEPGTETCRVQGVILRDGTQVKADAVVICTGGLSYPSTGSTGDGYRMAREAGHTILPTAPSLVPLTVAQEEWLSLQGLALKNVSVRVTPRPEKAEEPEQIRETPAAVETSDGVQEKGKGKSRKNGKKVKPVYTGFGELLFTHFGISGPLMLSASAYCDFARYPQGFLMELDLKPAVTEEELTQRLMREFALSPNKQFRNAILTLFPARLAERMAELAPFEAARSVHTLQEGEIRRFVKLVKAVPIELTGTRDYPEAVITRGGVSVREINPSTMESRRAQGLYFAGEVIDVDALTGGFNLQIAWSTGHLAGESIR
ncbi:MAG: NAD(P)/FAD-dependent oxidoreductase [Eubacteriales bacterium]|nr:NAD(P)/FAD-dependent oxidoreductase [Eubacteriales bacterium]